MPTPSRRTAALAASLVAAASTLLLVGTPAAGAAPAPPHATNGLIAFSDDRDGNREIYSIAADGSGLQRLTDDPAADTQPRWSPDGSQIAYLHGSSLWVMDADGTDAHQVLGYASDYQLTWSPDGARLAYARDGSIGVVGADGTDPHQVVAQVNPGYDLESPDWSPDGSRILYLRSTGPGSATLHTVKPDGTGDQEISASYGHTPRWSPDGTRLAFEESGLSVQVPGADPERLVLLSTSNSGLRGLSWAPDGSGLVYAQTAWDGAAWSHPQISTVAADGSGIQPLTAGWQPDWQPVPPVVPQTALTSDAGAWSLQLPALTFGSDRAGATFECSLDGAAWAACTSPYAPAWAAGDHGLRVRATLAGVPDPTPEAARWTTPYDDSQLAARGDWTSLAGDGYYRGGAVGAADPGAALTLGKVRATALVLVATTCRRCGTVEVRYGKGWSTTVRLHSRRTRNQVVIPVGTWATPHRAASVKVVVAGTGRPVRIDGLGVTAR